MPGDYERRRVFFSLSTSLSPVRLVADVGQVHALMMGRSHHDALKDLMNKKEIVGDLLNQLR